MFKNVDYSLNNFSREIYRHNFVYQKKKTEIQCLSIHPKIQIESQIKFKESTRK